MSGMAQSPHHAGPQLRARPPVSYHGPRRSVGGILPTPDPTVGSVISDEDVALQLMRLGDMANMSHGRTSTSTVDDALSGKAEAASSGEESEDDEGDLSLPGPRYPFQTSHAAGPRRKKQRIHRHSHECESSEDDHDDSSFRGQSDGIVPEDNEPGRRSGKPLPLAKSYSSGSLSGSGKDSKIKSSKVKSIPGQDNGTRKSSLGSVTQQLAPDEEDLSAKPRCQRCRKSKKGCDRQRPCGRCKDAGIGIEGCVSEDEGNGRRGRYGRHMGVVIKKDSKDTPPALGASPSDQFPGTFLTPAIPIDKGRKRKRST